MELFAPLLIGKESLCVEGLWEEMYHAALLVGRTGAVMRALSTIDIALWDLNARSVGLPLYQYLGANVLDRVPAYASGGYYRPGKTAKDLADKELLDRSAVRLLQPDATVCGGITEWRRIAATAASYGIPVSPHARQELHLHLVASTPNATYLEFFHDNTVTNFPCLIDRQFVCEKGYMPLPSGPGLDFNFDPEAISRYGMTDPGESDRWTVVR